MRAVRCGGHLALSMSLVAASFWLTDPASATSDGPDRFAVRDVRADDKLALRAQPNAGARKITALPPATRGIESLGCVDGKTGNVPSDTALNESRVWCKVRIGSLVGWASARFLREDTESPGPYSVSGAPTGPGQFIATSTVIEKTAAGDGRWKVAIQTVISQSTMAGQPNEVIVSSDLVDCRSGRSEVIRLTGDPPGYSTAIEEKQDAGFRPPLSDFDENNLWWATCRGGARRYR